MISIGFIIATIVYKILVCAIFVAIVVIINKKVLKKEKNIIEVAIIVWLILFAINLFAVVTDIPIAIGIPEHPYLDGGAFCRYHSLGYNVTVERDNILADFQTNTKVNFESWFK